MPPVYSSLPCGLCCRSVPFSPGCVVVLPSTFLLLWITKLLSCRKTERLRFQGERLWLDQVQVMSSLPQPREKVPDKPRRLCAKENSLVQPNLIILVGRERPQELQFKWIKVYVEEESFLSKLLCVLVSHTCLPVWLGDCMVICRYRGPREQAQLLCDTAQLWLLKRKKDHVVSISCAWGN